MEKVCEDEDGAMMEELRKEESVCLKARIVKQIVLVSGSMPRSVLGDGNVMGT